MWYVNLVYCMRVVGASWRREWRQHATAVAVIGTAMATVGLFGLVAYNAQLWLAAQGKQLHVVVFLQDDIEAAQRQAIETTLRTSAVVESVVFISKEQAWSEFRRWVEAGDTVLAGLATNPLPASYVASLSPAARHETTLAPLLQTLERLPGVEEVQYSASWLQRFRATARVFRLLGVGCGAFLLFGALGIMANTIRVLMHTHRQEIEILQLVGATRRFIKRPFLLIGFLQGTLGTLVGLGLLAGLHSMLARHLGEALAVTFGLPRLAFFPLPVFAGMLAAGALLGYIGSALSLRRLLHSGVR